MKKINDLKELGFDTTKLCVNAPYILKKEGHTYICSVVSVSDRTISVSYFTKDCTLAIELLTPAMDFELSIIGGDINIDNIVEGE